MGTFLKRLFGGDIFAATPTSVHPSTAAAGDAINRIRLGTRECGVSMVGARGNTGRRQ